MDLIKPGTTLSYVVGISKTVCRYVIESINDYKQIFLFDKETKRVVDKLKDIEEKEFKKFIQSFTQPLFDEMSKLLRSYDIDIETLG